MEVVGVIKDGTVELPASVHLPEGAQVRVIVAPEVLAATNCRRTGSIQATSISRLSFPAL